MVAVRSVRLMIAASPTIVPGAEGGDLVAARRTETSPSVMM